MMNAYFDNCHPYLSGGHVRAGEIPDRRTSLEGIFELIGNQPSTTGFAATILACDEHKAAKHVRAERQRTLH